MSFSNFKDLGHDILFYESHTKLDGGHHGCQESSRIGSGSPTLIIICTWLGGATNKRIERYTQRYCNIWPTSSMLLIRTGLVDFLARGEKSLHRRLRPAHREIRRIAIDPCSNPAKSAIHGGILLHIFSQGGTNMATHLVTSMNSILAILGYDRPLPLRQITFDSCPGLPDTNSTYAAGVHSLPKVHPLRPLGCAVLYIMAASISAMEAMGLKKPLAEIMRTQLNDPNVFPSKAARLYLSSRADKVVDSRHVETHEQQAAAKGLKTEMLYFDKAGHCSLMLEDESAYWNTVISCWERTGLPNMAEGLQVHTSTSPVVSGETRSRL